MRAGRPALPARAGLRVCGRDARVPDIAPGSRACGRDARAPDIAPGSRACGRDARAPGTRRIARMRAGRPRSRHAQDCAYAGETPAHPGTLRIARMRAGTPAHPGTLRIARMRARRPRSWHAQDCAYAGETPAHPGGAWFSVIAGMVRDWCQAGSGLSYCCPPGPCHISGRETETTNSFATTSRRSVARASCSMSCLARNTPLPR